MAITKTYTQEVHDAGHRDAVQALTAASTATPIKNYGVTTISSTQAKTFTIDDPKPGLRKTIALLGGSTAGDITVDGAGATFSGSTQLTFANAVAGGAELVGTSTGSYAVISHLGATLS